MPVESRSNRNHGAGSNRGTREICQQSPHLKVKNQNPPSLAARLLPFSDAAQRGRPSLFVLCLLSAFLAALFTLPLPASPVPQSTVQGIVRDAGGRGVAGAKVLLESGKKRRLATTGPDGAYRISTVSPGVYLLSVRCTGYSPLNRPGLRLATGETLTVNLVLHALQPLGGVQFYDHPHFTAAELENPAAGGGYSDAASTQGARMVKQYIFSGAPGSAASPLGTAQASTELGLSSAEALLVKRDFTEAASEFSAALSRTPNSGRAAAGLGLALYGEGKYGSAIDALERAASLAPSDPSPRLLMAEAARFAPGRQAEVSRRLAGFAASHSDIASGHYAYAKVLWEMFRRSHDPATFALARTECERAVALNPGSAGALNQLGVIYDHDGRWADAVTVYRKASRLDPDRASTRYRLARDLFHEGQTEEARSEMKAYESLQKAAPK